MRTLVSFGLAWGLIAAVLGPGGQARADVGSSNEGRLEALGPGGKALGPCPLKHTEVAVDVSGFIARVTVRQQFHNPFKDKIEAAYVFPLSQDGAVDQMTMKVGDRVIRGQIKEREEARAIYEEAKARGHVASLLDQERPNIFTQSVANIEPGEQVDITISYCETLKWKDGQYEFSFPMVVGPRYMPGGATGPATTGWAPPTDRVPDANRISPPITPPGTRAGHDISITATLNAGIPLRNLESRQHEIDVAYPAADKTRAVVRLKQQATIPNKDFVLVYQTATDEIADTVLTHTDPRGKFFTLVLQPPKRVRTAQIVPKELYFVIDSSGSMQGFPIETAKEAMRLCIEGLHPNDTFNLMTFSGHTSLCFDNPVANTDANRRKALEFLGHLRGGGGTEMMKAINACLSYQDDPQRVRVVCFMTDGYVGNDLEIVDAVKRNAGTARVFSFGIGTSVNRFLLDNMARAGRGEVHYVLNQQDARGAAERFYERVRTPVLTDVTLDFGGLKVAEVCPQRIPDLFSSTPVVVKGRYTEPGHGTITLRGASGSGKFERKIAVDFPAEEPNSDVLAPLWARAKVDDLMAKDMLGVQRGRPDPGVKEEILALGLRYQLLTQFTSFVAVEETRITKDGQSRTVSVPVEMPDGVSYEGVFGDHGGFKYAPMRAEKAQMKMAYGSANYGGGRIGTGVGMGIRPAAPPSALRSLPRPADARTMARRAPAEVDKKRAGERAGASGAPPAAAISPEVTFSDDATFTMSGGRAASKLAPELRGLAGKVTKQGKSGNLKLDKIEVQDGRVELRVYLKALSKETLDKLAALGFKEFGQAKGTNVVIGTIDVTKLDALAALEGVIRVEPST